jgi:hypothetical protein
LKTHRPNRRSENGGRRQAVGEASVSQRALVSQPPSPTTRSERERELENLVGDLRRQLHDALVANILDLRIGGGLLAEAERSKSQATMAKLSNEVLEIIRRDMLKIFSRLNAIVSPAPSMITEGPDYIA